MKPLTRTEAQIGTCIRCVHEVRYEKVIVKEAGYRHGARTNQSRTNRTTDR